MWLHAQEVCIGDRLVIDGQAHKITGQFVDGNGKTNLEWWEAGVRNFRWHRLSCSERVEIEEYR